MSFVFPPWTEELLDAGVYVTAMKTVDSNYGDRILFDVHLMAKSYLHLYLSPTGWRADMRYNEDHPVESFADLVSLARHGMHGRGFVSDAWAKILGLPLDLKL